MNHETYMQLALDLAAKGWPRVAPNPMVGCVIVHNGKVAASAYHELFGAAHAEVNAINHLPAEVPCEECVLYVTLEPCSHHGKTPPCVDLILKKGFKRVVVASQDPNPMVAGNGIKKLREAGVDVMTGVLEASARKLNKKFYCFHEQKRPYITLKWAVSSDGFISRYPIPADRSQNKITHQAADVFVHGLRAENMGIMVGKNTVIADNPALTVRWVDGAQPVRIIIDKQLLISKESLVFDPNSQLIVFNHITNSEKKHVKYIQLNPNKNDLDQICEHLYQNQIQSLLVEGGAKLLTSFIDGGLWDEIYIFENPGLTFGKGIEGPHFKRGVEYEWMGEDKIFHYTRADF